jgi:hypothetical protein
MFLHGRTCTKRNLSHALVHVLMPPSSYTHTQVVTNLQQTCSNAVPTTCHQDMFAACSQLVDKLSTACWQRYKVVELHRRVTSCSNNCCNNCCNNLLSSCISTICQQAVSDNLVETWQNNNFVTSCWQACYKPVAKTNKLWDFYVFNSIERDAREILIFTHTLFWHHPLLCTRTISHSEVDEWTGGEC